MPIVDGFNFSHTIVKVTDLVVPNPTPPPPPPPKGLWAEFMAFINRGGVLGLVIVFTMGTCIGEVVPAPVDDTIMLMPEALVPGGDWRSAIPNVAAIRFAIGDFVGVVIDFLIVAVVIFPIAKYSSKAGRE